MQVGQTAAIILPIYDWQPPEVEGDAVLLIEVDSLADSGQREWEVRAVRVGTATVTARGDFSSATWRFIVSN